MFMPASNIQKVKDLYISAIFSFPILIISVAISIIAYFSAWTFFWSGFEWSPFGYENCELEGIVWFIIILPLFLIVLFLKSLLVFFWKYSNIILIHTVFTGILLAIFSLNKRLLQ